MVGEADNWVITIKNTGEDLMLRKVVWNLKAIVQFQIFHKCIVFCFEYNRWSIGGIQ